MSDLGDLIAVGILGERNGLGLTANEAHEVGERIASHVAPHLIGEELKDEIREQVKRVGFQNVPSLVQITGNWYRIDSLDAAWAEAEAALAPRHGSIEVGGHPSAEESDRYLAAAHWYGRGGRKPQRDVYEPGPTPAAALRALAAKLRALAFEVDPSV